MPYEFETTEQRRNNMRKIRSKATKCEILLAKKLWANGIRYRKNFAKLPGKPDIAITKYKMAIFIDGEFWHGHDWENKKNRIVSNRDYWIPKIEKNILRDINNNKALCELGWKVLRFWEQDVKKNLNGCLLSIMTNCKDIIIKF